MKRKLAKVAQIDAVNPIEGADKIEVVTVQGWHIVVAKGEFKPNDMCVMFEIDSFLPHDDERYAFLAERCMKRICAKDGTELDKGIRIRSVRLRGVVSQGLVIPLDKFPEITDNVIDDNGEDYLINPTSDDEEMKKQSLIGANVSDLLKVRHYDEVIELYHEQCVGACGICAEAYAKFPSDFCPRTDEERIQNCVNYFKEMVGRTFEVSEKADGSSCTMMYCPSANPERPFRVCSRNNDLKRETSAGVALMWRMADKYDVEAKLAAIYQVTGMELAFQGELVGVGIQKNRDKLKENDWLVFRVYDIKKQKFFEPAKRRALCKELGFKHVTVIEENMDVFSRFHTCDEILKFAEGKTANGNEREGVVFKSSDGKSPFVSFKAVSNRYLLKQED